MATLGEWSFADLTGNSQYVLVGTTLYVVGNTSTAGQFAVYSSTNYGITVAQVLAYTFPNNSPEFDPAICVDSGNLIHIIGTRHNADSSDDVVKFTFNPSGPTLSGPYTIVAGVVTPPPPPWQANTIYALNAQILDPNSHTQQATTAGTSGATIPVFSTTGGTTADNTVVWTDQGLAQRAVLIGSDYDIVALTNGHTYAVVQVVDNVSFQEQVNGYEIDATGAVVGTQTLVSSPARGGQAYDSVSLVGPSGVANTIEAYMTSHPKVFSYADTVLTLGVFTTPSPAISWSSQTVLYTLPVRHLDNRLTVTANGNSRYLSDAYYTQNRAGLAGNMFLGYLADITNVNGVWSFQSFPGIPQASVVEPCINVFSDSSTVLGFITRDLTRNPAVDGVISVAQLDVATWQLTTRTDFKNPNPKASWLRGSKGVLPTVMNWGFIGESRISPGTSSFYSGYLVPPTAAISPVTVNPALRNTSYVFDASSSFDLNYETMTFAWSLVGAPAGVTITPNGDEATVFIPDSVGPSAQAFQVQVKVTTPSFPTASGSQIATANLTLPFIPAATITWPGTGGYSPNPINNVARNSNLVIIPDVTPGQVGLPLVYEWIQTSGTPVVLKSNNEATLTIETNGVSVDGEALIFALTVLDDINNPVVSTVTVNVLPYVFNGQDSLFLARSNWAVAQDYGIANITSVAVAGNELTILVPNNFTVGSTVSFQNIVHATFLNGQTVTVLTQSPTQFTATFVHGDYAATSDTGHVFEAYTVPGSGGSPRIVVVQNPPTGNQTFEDGGVQYLNGSQFVLVSTPPAQGQYNVNTSTGQYFFNTADGAQQVIITYALTQAATISQRNTVQFWPPLGVSAVLSNMVAFKRSSVLAGETRFTAVSPYSVTVYGDMVADLSAVLLRKLLIPESDSGLVMDAVHTEADYTAVLTTTSNLYRYSSAPLLNTDNPDTVIDLAPYITITPATPAAWIASTTYSLGDEILDTNGNVQIVVQAGTSFATVPTWNPTVRGITNDGGTLLWKNVGPQVVFNSVFSTDTFADVRVIALSGPGGCLLMQLDSRLFTVQGFFEITVESGLLYGADNVQWVREASMESLHSGQVLVGTLDSSGKTYETLIDLAHHAVLGTWDASKLKNQYVTTGEILFESESSYVGLPQAPTVSAPVLNPDNSVSLTWTVERPDLVQNYEVQASMDGGVFAPLAYVGSGIVLSITTAPLQSGHTYAFQIRSGGLDGYSQYSTPVYAYVGAAFAPAAQQITQVSGPSTGPFVAVVNWSQNSPNTSVVDSYTVQEAVSVTYPEENHSIPASAPFTITVTNPPAAGQAFTDQGVTYASGVALTRVNSNPGQGQYTVTLAGVYGFSMLDATQAVLISYTNAAAFATVATVDGGANTSYTAGPLAAGATYSFRVQAHYNGILTPWSATMAITFPTGAEVEIPAQMLPGGTMGTAYYQQVFAGYVLASVSVFYGVSPYAWTLASGSLPTGLTLDPQTGTIYGTPTTPGTYNFTVGITDSAQPAGYTATSPTLTIVIS